jgi:UPF0755 protein
MKLTSGSLIVLLVVALGLVVAISGGWSMLIGTPGPLQVQQVVLVTPGSSVNRIAHTLEKEGVISSAFMFKIAVRASLLQSSLQAGGYVFEPRASLKQVIGKLSTGDVAQQKITFPEGLTTAEILTRLNHVESLAGDALPLDSYAEGALLPETYTYTIGEKRSKVAARMALAMQDVVAEAWDKRYTGLPFETPHELVILASIVEKETAVAAERAEVASVFINRLLKDMKLEADPTVIYGASNYNGNITRAHLQEDQPYNTYVHKGLPPTPIANPGRDALMASANPAHTDYLFFVADGYGGHVFAENYQQHQKNVQKYVKIYKEQQKKTAQ